MHDESTARGGGGPDPNGSRQAVRVLGLIAFLSIVGSIILHWPGDVNQFPLAAVATAAVSAIAALSYPRKS